MNVSSVSGSYGVVQPQVMSGASSMGGPTKKMTNLFAQMDSTGSGSISKSQLEQAFQTKNPPQIFKAMGVDSLFSQLDPNGTGNVSKEAFISTMAQMIEGFRQSGQGATPSPADSLAQASQSLGSATPNTGSNGAQFSQFL